MRKEIKSGVFFVKKQDIKHFLTYHVNELHCDYSSDINTAIKIAENQLRSDEYFIYSVAKSGRLGRWIKRVPESQLKDVYDRWDNWDFSEQYKEIWKQKRKITI